MLDLADRDRFGIDYREEVRDLFSAR